MDCHQLSSPLKIPFSTGAEHVGILRNEGGNLPHIMARVKAHRGALNAILHTGAARAHRGNPAASLKIWKLYALPVLMKGLGSLVLLQSEITIIAQHIKETQEKLMRLYPKTPQCVVSFLASRQSPCSPENVQHIYNDMPPKGQHSSPVFPPSTHQVQIF